MAERSEDSVVRPVDGERVWPVKDDAPAAREPNEPAVSIAVPSDRENHDSDRAPAVGVSVSLVRI